METRKKGARLSYIVVLILVMVLVCGFFVGWCLGPVEKAPVPHSKGHLCLKKGHGRGYAGVGRSHHLFPPSSFSDRNSKACYV